MRYPRIRLSKYPFMSKAIHNSNLDEITYSSPERMKPIFWFTSSPDKPEASNNGIKEDNGSNES
jgi:hypothetical protein